MNDHAPFDRGLLQRRRRRAAGGIERHEFVLLEVADRLADRLEDVNRTFPRALDLGSHHGLLGRVAGGRGGIATLVQADPCPALLARAGGLRVAADEEMLPFAEEAFDLVFSAMSLHLANDLPGALLQARRSLRPDGLFLAALPGGDTLRELREAFLHAELECEGGTSPRVAPMADLRDLGSLLQRAGFALPTVDRDLITLTYETPFDLMRELRGLGQANMLNARRRTPLRRATLARAAEIYAERFGRSDGRIGATVEIVMLTGWAPHEDQPRALQPGSARQSLARALDGEERSAGEAARPGRKPL